VAVLWAASIFAVIPLARAIERVVRDGLGQRAFGFFAIAAIAAACAAGIVRSARRSAEGAGGPRDRALDAAWLVGVGLAFAAATASLWSNPVEAMHFVQYGVLSLLLQRALAHRYPDASSFSTAALLGTLVGCVDEAVQWAVPSRYFGLRDILLNALACVLAQVGLAMGVRPANVARRFSPRGARAACRAALAIWACLVAFALNTPARVSAWAPLVPGLGYLATNESTMMEYGHRFEDPQIGVFRSRLSREELAREDAARASEVARLIDAHRDSYGAFLVDVPPQRDAFAHELRVHLFRRDRYLEFHLAMAGDGEAEQLERRKLATVVAREDRLVRRYFPRTFAASSYALAPDVAARIASDEIAELDYESTVSADLVTAIDEPRLALVFACALAALLAALRMSQAAVRRESALREESARV